MTQETTIKGVAMGLSGLNGLKGLSAVTFSGPWYNAGNAPDPIAVYQPLGAADLATSYVNLINPGTYDAAPGVAPTFDSRIGWIFDGTQHLETGLNPQGNWTVLVQYSNYVHTGFQPMLFGSYDGTEFFLGGSVSSGGIKIAYYNSDGGPVTGSLIPSAGNIGISYITGYLNGIADGVLDGSGNIDGTPMLIGAGNIAGTPDFWVDVDIQAIAIYDSALTPSQVLSVAKAMQSLMWYRAGGAPEPVAVYQPVGAADLASSYVNLVNPGTYDATPGVAPTWDDVNGWIFNGSTQYLDTGLSPQSTWTVLVQFSNSESGESGGCDYFGISSFTGSYFFGPRTTVMGYTNATSIWLEFGSAPFVSSGNIGIAGANGYLNGGNTPSDAYIGATNADFQGAPDRFIQADIQAVVIYNQILTPAQVLAVSNAMAAL